jgi:hypothetical protein
MRLLEVALDDALPFALDVTVMRVRAWAERLLSEALDALLAPQSTGTA